MVRGGTGFGRSGLRLLLNRLGEVDDPREPCKVRYPLCEVLFLVTCGALRLSNLILLRDGRFRPHRVRGGREMGYTVHQARIVQICHPTTGSRFQRASRARSW